MMDPSLAALAETGELRERVHVLYERRTALAHSLFSVGACVDKDPALGRFHSAGLLEPSRNGWRARNQIWIGQGMQIISGRRDDPRRTRVFPIFGDEGAHLASLASNSKASNVLDYGTGSGIVAIAAARKGSRVVACDINPTALSMAALNSSLNSVRDRVRLVSPKQLDAYRKPIFDLIISNPPFAAIPPGCPFHLSGDGGPDGLQIVRHLFALTARLLKPGGTLVVLCLSLRRNGVPYAVELGEDILGDRVAIEWQSVYDEYLVLKEYCAIFREWHKRTSWYTRLRNDGFDSMGYFLLVGTAKGKNCASATNEHLSDPPCHSSLSGSWDARLRRYEGWLEPYR